MATKEGSVAIEKKYALTIKEASEYFNIGTNKLYETANDSYNDAVLRVGNHKLIRREKFEQRLDKLCEKWLKNVHKRSN